MANSDLGSEINEWVKLRDGRKLYVTGGHSIVRICA